MNRIYYEDCLNILPKLEEKSISLIYIDPPFNTGNKQKRKRQQNREIDNKLSSYSYEDNFQNYEDFLIKRVKLSLPLLKENGSLFIHINQKEVHYIKVALDKLLGREHFINEIIYCWDYGARNKKKWSVKHDNILWYVKNTKNYIFNYEDIDRIPYKAPDLIRNTSKNAEEKIAKGKCPTSVWDIGIVHTLSKESTKYPTQKPLKLLERIIKVHSNEGDTCLDYFAGAGSLGEAAIKNRRNFILIDKNKQAINVMKNRFSKYENIKIIGIDS